MDKIAEQYVEMGRLMALGFQQQMIEDGILDKEAFIREGGKRIVKGFKNLTGRGTKKVKDAADATAQAAKDGAEKVTEATKETAESVKETGATLYSDAKKGVGKLKEKAIANPGKAAAGVGAAGVTTGLAAGYAAGNSKD